MQISYDPWSIKKEGTDFWGIKINDGKYKDTIISINDMSFDAINENEIKLDYEYLIRPKHLSDHDFNSDEFNQIISFILEDILRKAIDEDRDNNTSESN
jgi:sulfite reductase beta subunit-like hemoprotein